ncbi:putative trypsin-6 [Eurosta solidaginis]|uniref:putative trypsin-6 n=1 Tax=Eurosta solidaginis TaxID=178769 RepID=UPI00353070E5
MCSLNKYYLMLLLLYFTSCNDSLQRFKTHPSDFVFLITGGHRIWDMHKYTRSMVSLRTRTVMRYFGDNHYCAGVIIGKRWILTAAQCAIYHTKVPRRPRSILVVTGTKNRIVKSKSTRIIAVDRVVVHTGFILNGTNDIAVLHLKEEIEMDNNTQIMALPTKPPPYGAQCTVLGWGRLYPGGPYAALVAHVELLLYTQEQCQKRHPHYTPGDLCAGDNVDFDHDPCRGDTGGPLMCNDKLVALVSRTLGCGTNKYPSLYTDIYYHLPWIKRATSGKVSLFELYICVYKYKGCCL